MYEKPMYYASFGQRVRGSIVDAILILGIIVLVGNVGLYLIMQSGTIMETNHVEIYFEIVFWSVLVLYNIGMIASNWQATLGKRSSKIKVVNYDGGRISTGQSCIRFLVSLVSSITIIGYLMAAFTENKQTLHDLVAKTYVIKNN